MRNQVRKSSDTVVRRYSKYLPVRLSDDELRDRGSSLAHLHKSMDELELKAAEVNAQFKDQRKIFASEAKRLSEIVRAKQEPREVAVEVRMTKKAGVVEEVRLDTGEVVLSRKMDSEEAQVDLLDIPAGASPFTFASQEAES